MHEKMPLERLGIKSAIDLCAVDDGGQPLSFSRDLRIPEKPGHQPSYRQPAFSDPGTFWQGSAP